MKKNYLILFFSTCILITSCSENSIDITLSKVERIVMYNPDSALILLNQIKNNIINEEQQIRSNLLAVYATDLSNKNIFKYDSSIIYSIIYLRTNPNIKYLSFSEYYLGRIFQA
jgi:hypothetical protein